MVKSMRHVLIGLFLGVVLSGGVYAVWMSGVLNSSSKQQTTLTLTTYENRAISGKEAAQVSHQLAQQSDVRHTVDYQSQQTYRVLQDAIQVNKNYKINIYLVVQTDESKHRIVRVMEAQLDPVDGRTAKVFAGELYTNIEAANRVYYAVNGDLFRGNPKFGKHYAYLDSSNAIVWQ